MSRSSDDDTGPGAARIDRWLFAVRLFKSRSLAAEAVGGGKVHLNGERVKASREVRAGDEITFMRGAVLYQCTVTGVPERRGPASQASQCYEESAESKARREQHAERMRVAAALAPRPVERPDKHQRQQLRRLRGRE